MSPKIVNKEQKKSEILHAAMKVFAQKGVVKSKMIDIAEAARIGKGTIYEYFKSKEDIFAESYKYFFESTLKAITASVGSTGDPIEKLKRLVDVTLTESLEHAGDFFGIMMEFWAEGVRKREDKILKIVNLEEIYAEYRKIISAILDDGIKKGVFKKINKNNMAAVLIAALDGLMLQWFMDKNIFDLNDVSNFLLDSFLNGIRK